MAALYRDERTFFSVKDDTWTALAIWSIMSYIGYVSSINHLVNLFTENPTAIDTLLIAGVLGIFILLGTVTALKKMQRKEFLLIIAVIMAWFISFLLDENARQLLKMFYFKPILIEGVCGIICIARYRDWEKFQKIGYFFIIPAMILFFVNAAYTVNGDIEEGYMSFSYNNLIFVLASYCFAIRGKNILMWILAIIGTLVIIITGCRGAVLCIAVYVMLEMVFNNRIHKAIKVGFLIILTLLYFNMENMMVSLSNYLTVNFDYESRTIEMFFEGAIEDDSGRGQYTDAAIEVIEENPIFGCGMAGSSYHLYEALHDFKPVGVTREYSHNLILDIYMDYGILLGTVILVYIIYQLIMAYIRSRKRPSQKILFLMASAVIPKLMLSSTYVGEAMFFILLGLLVNINDNREPVEELNGEV